MSGGRSLGSELDSGVGEVADFGRGLPRRGDKATITLGVIVAVLVLAIIGAAVVVFTKGDGDSVARYEAADFATPLPFTEPVLNEDAGVPVVRGPSDGDAVPVSYIPSQACDPAKLKRELAQKPDAARAWAGIFGIETSEIDSFIDGLSSATLIEPLMVTNHDYESGEAIELQSVLAAGTAVLVNDAGEPVIRCACGNPLKPAKGTATEVTGAPADFDLAEVSDEVKTPEDRPAGTDCAQIQLSNGNWVSVLIIEGPMSCGDAIGVGYNYTETVNSGFPVLLSCRTTGDRSSACRSSNGVIQLVDPNGPPGPASSTTSTPTTTTTAPSAPQLSGPGTECGTVANRIGGQSPVIVQRGRVDCAEALDVAAYFFDNVERSSGQSRMLTIDQWSCSVPILPDRPRSDSYIQCTDYGTDTAFQIGE